jgi:hypothetical protein
MWLHTRSGNIDARAMLGRAVTINPDFGAAHACVAVTHVNDYINGWAEILATLSEFPRNGRYRGVISTGRRNTLILEGKDQL